MILRRHHVHLHHGLQEHRSRHTEQLLERHRRTYMKRALAGVDIVIVPIEEGDRQVDDGKAGVHPLAHRRDDPLLHRWYVFLRDVAAFDLVDELEA